MPRITKVYTRTGDDGSTGLGGGQRVGKDSSRVEAYGTVDELNSALGVALAAGLLPPLPTAVPVIQNQLFHLGSGLCVREEDKARLPVPQVEDRHVVALEELMDELSAQLGPLDNFILPGGSAGAAHLHLARAICRRAERAVVRLAREEAIGEHAVRYLNRLSDALFVMARFENRGRQVPDALWNSRA